MFLLFSHCWAEAAEQLNASAGTPRSPVRMNRGLQGIGAIECQEDGQ